MCIRDSIKTKAAIEQLTDEQIREFLKAKWITPVVTELFKLPVNIVNELISKLEVLSKKYETTFEEVDEEIKETEKSLCTMIDDLVGNDFDMQGLAELKKLLGGV